jgi:hypothetical protein
VKVNTALFRGSLLACATESGQMKINHRRLVLRDGEAALVFREMELGRDESRGTAGPQISLARGHASIGKVELQPRSTEQSTALLLDKIGSGILILGGGGGCQQKDATKGANDL